MQPERPDNYWKPEEVEQTPTPQTPVVTVSDTIETEEDIDTQSVAALDEPIRWQAHEYIHHERDLWWFVVFGVVVVALMAVAVFVVQSWTFAILVPVMAAALIVYVRRPPRVLDYTLSGQGLYINDLLYPFADYKAFGVIQDGEESSIMMIPVQRFKPGVTVYFPDESGEAIVDLLGSRLPMRELHLDALDRILRKLRL